MTTHRLLLLPGDGIGVETVAEVLAEQRDLPHLPPSEAPGLMSALVGFWMDPNGVYLSPAPLYHTAPSVWSLSMLGGGITVVVLEPPAFAPYGGDRVQGLYGDVLIRVNSQLSRREAVAVLAHEIGHMVDMLYLTDLDRKRILASVVNMRTICDSLFLFDRQSRVSPKLDELEKLGVSFDHMDGGAWYRWTTSSVRSRSICRSRATKS